MNRNRHPPNPHELSTSLFPCWPEESGKELVVEDVLVLCVEDAAGLLVQLLVVPVTVDSFQLPASGIIKCEDDLTFRVMSFQIVLGQVKILEQST